MMDRRFAFGELVSLHKLPNAILWFRRHSLLYTFSSAERDHIMKRISESKH